MIAVDFDAKKLWMGVNGTWLVGDPANGLVPTAYNWSGTPDWAASLRGYYNGTRSQISLTQLYRPSGFLPW
jgi:hypothetical protein